jgi:hypothetical protein
LGSAVHTKGFWIGVCLGEEAVDGSLQFVEGSEDAALETPARELGEEGLDGVEPRCRGRCEVEGPASMAGEPLTHLGMFVGGVVVDDGMDRHSPRHPRLDGVEESDGLLMAVTLHVVADDSAVDGVEGGEQRRALVAV